MSDANTRVADHPIDPSFLERWSARAFNGETVPEAELMTMFEAARWAPSSYNSQPWRYIYALRNTPSWAVLFGLLNEMNQSWAKDAGALVVALSKSTLLPPGKDREIPSYSHSYDAGAGWAYLALQASKLGWTTHAMVGFDMDSAFAKLEVPDGYRVECAIAIGRRGDKSRLSERMQAIEAPNGRLPLAKLVMEGRFRPEA